VAERLFALIPPSQGKAPGGRRQTSVGTFDVLEGPRREVLDALRTFVATASIAQLEIALGARGPLLQRALAATQQVLEGTAPVLPAWRRYEGVVWSYLAPESMTPAQRRRILVPSGLYGLLAGDDRIAEYRLKMNVRLTNLPPLARFWRPSVTEALLERTTHATIVNFLPKEHVASVDMERVKTRRNVIDVHFVATDESKAVGHDAKAVKGELARAVLREGVAAFSVPERLGWRVERRDSDVIVSAPPNRAHFTAP
jgi:cytoplasmic iron level regulating protein YaaA (DUF328/UPF0246 family)